MPPELRSARTKFYQHVSDTFGNRWKGLGYQPKYEAWEVKAILDDLVKVVDDLTIDFERDEIYPGKYSPYHLRSGPETITGILSAPYNIHANVYYFIIRVCGMKVPAWFYNKYTEHGRES
jgi:hypothetical protein